MGHAPTPPKRGDMLGTKAEQDEYLAWASEFRQAYNTCGSCGSTKLTLRSFDDVWRDGDLYCENGHYVRGFDAG